MHNIKSITQKDRYGNMFSLELFEDQGVPLMIMVPNMSDGFNGADTSDHPGEPRGTDTVPAWLTPGENVVNAEASRLPGNQEKIDAMNEQGRQIQAAQGGPIPTYAAGGSQIPRPDGMLNSLSNRLGDRDGGPMYAAIGTEEDDTLRKFLQMAEGKKNKAYLDSAGIPTIGYGNTYGVQMGDKISDAEANQRLMRDIAVADENYNKLVTVDLNPNQQAAVKSLLFNIGGPQFANSKARAALNAGDFDAFQKEASEFRIADGKVLPGLESRRAKEMSLFNLPYETRSVGPDAFGVNRRRVATVPTPNATPPVPREENLSFWDVVTTPTGELKEKTGRTLWETLTTPIDELKYKGDPSKANTSEDSKLFDADQIQRAAKYPLEMFGVPVGPDAPGVPVPNIFKEGKDAYFKFNDELYVKDMKENEEELRNLINERKVNNQPVSPELVAAHKNALINVAKAEKQQADRIANKKEETEAKEKAAKEAQAYVPEIVNNIIAETDTGEEQDQPPPDANTNNQVVNAGVQGQRDNPGFFKEATGLFLDVLGDMFPPKDLARMVINYTGSRMLGYEHNGSLNYAMKDYATRAELQAKQEYELVKANKDNYTAASFNKYIRSGNVEDLVAKGVGIKETSGSTYLRGSGIIPTVKLTDGSEGVLINGQAYSVSTVIDKQGTTIADIMEPVDKDIHSVQAVRKRLDKVAEDARSAANTDIGLEAEKGLSDDTQAIAMQAASKFNKILLRNGASIAQSEDLEIAVNGAIQDYYTARAIAKRDGTTAPTSVEGFVETRLITPLTNNQISMDMVRGTSVKNLRALNKQIYNDMEIKDKLSPLFQREYADEWAATKNAWQLLSTEERADWTRKASKRDDYSAFTLWMSKTPAKEIDKILKEQSN